VVLGTEDRPPWRNHCVNASEFIKKAATMFVSRVDDRTNAGVSAFVFQAAGLRCYPEARVDWSPFNSASYEIMRR
jgi:hypothetical protein